MPSPGGKTELAGRLGRVLAKLKSLVGSAKGAARDASVAQANVEALTAELGNAKGLGDVLEDPELADVVAADIARIEQVVESYEEVTFFKKPPQLAKLSVAPAAHQHAHVRQPVVWRLGSVDLEHPQQWCQCESGETLRALVAHLRDLERYTWGELPSLSDSNHEWEDMSAWEKPSQERVRELNLDDQSGWYQLHLSGRGRLFGFRMGNVFNIVWWDRDHEVYETKQLKKSQRT